MGRRPPDSRIQILELDERRWKIILPGRPTAGVLFACLFLLCWLAGLAVGGTFALREFMQDRRRMEITLKLVLWFVAWSASGLGAMLALRRFLETCFGFEGLLLRPDRVVHARVLWGASAERIYETPQVERFVVERRLRMIAGRKRVTIGHALSVEEIPWLAGELNGILAKLRE